MGYVLPMPHASPRLALVTDIGRRAAFPPRLRRAPRWTDDDLHIATKAREQFERLRLAEPAKLATHQLRELGLTDAKKR